MTKTFQLCFHVAYKNPIGTDKLRVAYSRRRISGGRKNSKSNYCYTFCPGRRVGMNKPLRRDGTFLLRPAILAFTKT